jgi:hypothetical protein
MTHLGTLLARATGVALLSLAATTATAGTNEDATLILHLVPAQSVKRATCVNHGITDCSEIVTSGDLDTEYYAYVMATDLDTATGIAGVQFGISYDDTLGRGVDVFDFGWQYCTLLEWPTEDWPRANTGNLLTWNQNTDCQRGFPVVVGFFTVVAHSPDRLRIIPRPVDGLARVSACGLNTVNAPEKMDDLKLENLGWADFGGYGGGQGYNPCDPGQNLLKLQNKFKPIKD